MMMMMMIWVLTDACVRACLRASLGACVRHSFYGSVLNTPTILDGVFGTNNTVQATCWQTLVVDLAAFPGVIGGIYSLKARSVHDAPPCLRALAELTS